MGSRGWMVLTGLVLTAMPGSLSANLTFEPVLNVSGTAGNSRQPHIAIDQAGTLHLAYADDTGTPDTFRILYRRSFDQGRTFTSPMPISVGAGGALRPRLAVFGGAGCESWPRPSLSKQWAHARSPGTGSMGLRKRGVPMASAACPPGDACKNCPPCAPASRGAAGQVGSRPPRAQASRRSSGSVLTTCSGPIQARRAVAIPSPMWSRSVR
jgi:hypothetical protein